MKKYKLVNLQEEKEEREGEQITTVYEYMTGNVSMTNGQGERDEAVRSF